MKDAEKIKAKLVGPEKAKERRAELLAELGESFAEGGPQRVTGEMTRRVDTLVDLFADQLQELKKRL